MINTAKTLIDEKFEDCVNAEDKEFLSLDTQFVIPNLQEQAQMLEWAGINFGEDYVFILQKSLKRLAVLTGASSVKFFGKIFGTQKDYWIACGSLSF